MSVCVYRYTATVSNFKRKGQTEHTWWYECELLYDDGERERFDLSRDVWRLVEQPAARAASHSVVRSRLLTDWSAQQQQ
jgi:hypothetical protein